MDLLKMLAQAAGPSGSEERVRELIRQQVNPLADEVYTDNLGNLIARIKGNGPKVMLDAHMDEIGVIVTFVEKNGFLRFANLGGVSPQTALSQRVRFLNGVLGVVHREQKEYAKPLALSDLYIDIGAKDREEAERKIQIGAAACFEGSFEKIGDRVISKALDDRTGCFVLLEAMKRVRENGPCKNDLYFVFSVTEELGLRGAKAAAGGVEPDFAVAVDVTATGDLPGKNKMAVKLGDGPAVKVKDNSILCHPYMKELMVQTCKKHAVPYQMEVLEGGSTNAGAIHISNGGVITGAISVPARFIHTPNEMVDINDMNGAVTLLSEMIKTGFFM